MKEIIRTIVYEWKNRKLPKVLEREINLSGYKDVAPGKIIMITGFRRVGKTYAVFHFIDELLKDMDKEEVVYINFEDERIPVVTKFLTELLPVIKETNKKEVKYLFLDEIQNIPNWSKWLRRICDTENVMIFVTGSSSKLSNKDIPTELRGRALELKVFPLSFSEFLNFKGIKVDADAAKYSENEKAKVMKAVNEYVTLGGMPEVVLASEDRKPEIIQQYYGTVVRKDIVERNGVKNEENLKNLMRMLMNSTYYSISKSYDSMKSMGYKIGKTTLQRYIGYIENSYFMYSLPFFSYKVKDQLQYPRKVFFIDNSFIGMLSTKFSRNTGRLYENAVFIELKRREKPLTDIYYWKDRSGKEVDFVVMEDAKVKQLIQVCYDIGDYDTKKREIKALLKASRELKCRNLMVITSEHEGVERVKNKTVKFVPLWKWLLAGKP
jgi:hypothetical protein